MFFKTEAEPFLAVDSDDVLQSPTSRYTRMRQRLESLKYGLALPHQHISCLITFLATSLFWVCILSFRGNCHPHHVSNTTANTYHELQLSDLSDYGDLAMNARLLSCGFSISEAKALGCKYDILVGKWLPDICIDQIAIDQYQADGSWFGYADWNRTEILTIEQMAEKDVYYTSARDHIVHCSMLWVKQYEAFFDGRGVFDSIIASREHTHHCAKFLVDMTDWGTEFRAMPIPVFVGQAGCFVKN
ncbi:hypothetical protein BKA64DRAFT_711808 [Cadophora sp. MPI-SDFR-AT-0126]|nr:hypothetical protein BKA64DRAFT_711808 [Leotiomycetes sp. MPI-SDFR-AT-0126]